MVYTIILKQENGKQIFNVNKQEFDDIDKQLNCIKTKTFYITYRGEFSSKIEATDREDAIYKFQNNDCDIEVDGDLWDEFIKVEED